MEPLGRANNPRSLAGMRTATSLRLVREHPDHVELVTDGPRFRLYSLGDGVLRLRATFADHFPPERSYALVTTAWPDAADELLGPERTRIAAGPLKIHEAPDHVRIDAPEAQLSVTVRREPFAVDVDTQHGPLHRDLPEGAWAQDSLGRIRHASQYHRGDAFYGLGERAGELNKRGHRLALSAVDSLGWDPVRSDPLYKHIPFYLHVDPQGTAHGVFYHSAFPADVDFGRRHSNYWPPHTTYTVDAPTDELDLFLLRGPSVGEVIRRYTWLTGTTAMQPRASLGYLGSTMYYTELPERSDDAILGFLDSCRRHRIPCDAFFLSSGYTADEDTGERNVFTWNARRFPDPTGFVAELRRRGVDLVPNIKPGMLVDHPLLPELPDDALVAAPGGESPATARFWGGRGHLLDFTSPPTGRAAWSALLRRSLLDLGVRAVWNDNNEYENLDAQSLVRGEGEPGAERQRIEGLRPVMSLLMALVGGRAIEAAGARSPGGERIRPYVTSRGGFAGIQRYAQTWAGDNSTSWESLDYNLATVLGMGLSGVANQGCDVGGFAGPAPSPELLLRWVQCGILFPRFSIHSSNSDNTVTEPWMYPSVAEEIAAAIRLRYRLAPLLYSLLWRAHRTGQPMLRPLVYDHPADPTARNHWRSFLLGPLLAAPVLQPEVEEHRVYLPQVAGTWVELATGRRLAGGWHTERVQLDSIPLYLRPGGILPTCPGLMTLHGPEPIKHLRILVDCSAPGAFEYYEDDGESTAYREGEYLATELRVAPVGAGRAGRDGSAEGVGDHRQAVVSAEPAGGRGTTAVNSVELVVYCPDHAPRSVALEGADSATLPRLLRAPLSDDATPEAWWYFDGEQRRVVARFPTPGSQLAFRLVLDFGVKDLVGM